MTIITILIMAGGILIFSQIVKALCTPVRTALDYMTEPVGRVIDRNTNNLGMKTRKSRNVKINRQVHRQPLNRNINTFSEEY